MATQEEWELARYYGIDDMVHECPVCGILFASMVESELCVKCEKAYAEANK